MTGSLVAPQDAGNHADDHGGDRAGKHPENRGEKRDGYRPSKLTGWKRAGKRAQRRRPQ
jgi:hypothetical protein